MEKTKISIIDINKDTKLGDLWYDSMACKIISTLYDMQENVNATIIRIEHSACIQDEKLAIVKNLCGIYDSAPGSSVIYADVYVGPKGWLAPEKHYDPGFGNPEEIKDKKSLPLNEIYAMERKMYSELGFESIKEALEYSYWDTMVYANDIGRRLIDRWFEEANMQKERMIKL